MIRGFEENRPLEPETSNCLQWSAALGAGLIAAIVLLLVPRGSPWASITFFTPVVVGRSIPTSLEIPLLMVMMIHFAVSILYGLLVSLVAANLTQLRAAIAGGVVGLLLYLVNFGIVSMWLPYLRGNEVSVLFTHVVFGLIAGGAYRGLLRRRRVPASEQR